MFQPALTGKYKNKVRDAAALEKSAEGGWDVGESSSLIPNTLDLFTQLANKGR